MKKIINIFQYFLIICLLSFTFFTYELSAQCQQFLASYISSNCDDNGTDTDTLDDTYTVSVYVGNDANPNGTWSSSDGSYTNHNYTIPFVTFGPYLITNGDVTVIITDDQFGCSDTLTFVAPSPCSYPPVICPAFDLCYELVSTTNCSATYEVSIQGNLEGYTFGPISFNWYANGGSIDDVSFFQPITNPLSLSGVTISGTTASGGSEIKGSNILLQSPHFLITVSTGLGNCVSLHDGLVGIRINGENCFKTDTICPEPEEFCSMGGHEVSGFVSVPPEIYDCTNTENHGVEGVEILITSAGGETCEAITENDGSYSCTLCDDGPYEVCVTTTCDNSCGLTIEDIFLIHQQILGVKAVTKDFIFIGDANQNGNLSTRDLVFLISELMGADTTLVRNWCRFLPYNEYLNAPNPTSTSGGYNYAQSDSCIVVANASDMINFVRLMIGDVNGSCTDCSHSDGEGEIPIVIEDDPPNNKVIVKSPITDNLYGFSLKIGIPSGTTISSINSPLTNLEYTINNGVLMVIWIDTTTSNSGYETVIGENLVEIITSESAILVLEPNGNFISTENLGINSLIENQETRSIHPSTQSIFINSQIMITTPPIEGEGKLMIYDIFGREKYNQLIDANTNAINTTLNTGVYIVNINDQHGSESYKVFLFHR